MSSDEGSSKAAMFRGVGESEAVAVRNADAASLGRTSGPSSDHPPPPSRPRGQRFGTSPLRAGPWARVTLGSEFRRDGRLSFWEGGTSSARGLKVSALRAHESLGALAVSATENRPRTLRYLFPSPLVSLFSFLIPSPCPLHFAGRRGSQSRVDAPTGSDAGPPLRPQPL